MSVEKFVPMPTTDVLKELYSVKQCPPNLSVEMLEKLSNEYCKLHNAYTALENVYNNMVDDFGKVNSELININQANGIDLERLEELSLFYDDCEQFFRKIRKNKIIDAIIYADKAKLIERSRKSKRI